MDGGDNGDPGSEPKPDQDTPPDDQPQDLNDRVEKAVQEKMADGGDITSNANSLRKLEGPHKMANPESGLGSNQVRYQANMLNEVTGESSDWSVNYDPDTGQFGIIKRASGR